MANSCGVAPKCESHCTADKAEPGSGGPAALRSHMAGSDTPRVDASASTETPSVGSQAAGHEESRVIGSHSATASPTPVGGRQPCPLATDLLPAVLPPAEALGLSASAGRPRA